MRKVAKILQKRIRSSLKLFEMRFIISSNKTVNDNIFPIFIYKF